MRPLITRRHALAGLVVTSLAGGRAARADEPKRLIGVIEEDPPFFNPAVSSGISSFVAGAPCYSALTRLSLDGKIGGDLAESFEISPDGLIYTFKLRPNIVWHDGHAFSAEDVKFSLERYRGGAASTLRERVAGVDVLDPLRVRIRLK